MLIWMTAMLCEARPVIEHFGLKKSHDHHAFEVYQSEDTICVVSGIGSLPMAAATAWIAALNRREKTLGWINLGLAGGMEELGRLYRIVKIRDSISGKHYYPMTPFKTKLDYQTCETVSQPSCDYKIDRVFDMEASAYFATASRFSTAEFIHSLKVVSDNPVEKTGKNEPRSSELITRNLPRIIAFAEQLRGLLSQSDQIGINRSRLERWLAAARYTQSQQSMLQTHLAYLLNRGYDEAELLNRFKDENDGRRILKELKTLCIQDSRNL
jgi:adenosylhomocysteine nucleosidase